VVSIKKIVLVVIIYFMSFILLREAVTTYMEWQPTRLFIPHNKFNHITTPNFPHEKIIGRDKNIKSIKINSQGIREDEDVILPKPGGVYRILMVGDSFIFGGDKPDMPDQLEKTLNEFLGTKKLKFDVLNCGVPSYSPMLHLARLKHQYLSFDPDAIIYFPDLTDVYDDTHRYKWLAKFDDAGKLVSVIGSTRILRAKRRHKRQVNYLLKMLGLREPKLRDVRSQDKSQYPHIFDHAMEAGPNISSHTLEEIEFTLSFIKSFIKTSRREHIFLSILMYPHLPQIISANQAYSTNFASLYNRLFEKKVQEMAWKEGVSFKSFFKSVKKRVLAGENLYEENDMHFNENGFQFLGSEIARWVIQNPETAIGFFPANSDRSQKN
jgi:hypothetical protein